MKSETETEELEIPPAVHIKSLIPPASQINVIWKAMGLHGDERKLYFHHADDNAKLTDIPPVLRCDEEPWEEPCFSLSFGSLREDVQKKIESKRDYIKDLVKAYEQTQVEREDLVIQLKTIKKAQQHDDLKQVHSKDRIFLKRLPKLTPVEEQAKQELQLKWNEELKQHKLGEIEIFETESLSNPWRERSENDEKTSDAFEGLRIINDGVRDTTAPVEERRRLFPLWQRLINPYNLSEGEWELETDQEKEQFAIIAAKNLTVFHNTPVDEAAALTGLDATPGALVKRFSRVGKKKQQKPNWKRMMGHYFCIVHLNGQDYFKVLAPLDAPFTQACDAFLKKMRASKLSAAKEERRKKKPNLTERVKAASERVQRAYSQSWITRADPSFWQPPQDAEGGVVTYLAISEGKSYGD